MACAGGANRLVAKAARQLFIGDILQEAAVRPSPPDGIRDASDQESAHNNRGNASRFEDGKLPKVPRIECHTGIIGGCRARALIWIMGLEARCRQRALGVDEE